MLKSILSGLIFLFSTNSFSEPDSLKTVGHVDLKKYAGVWYEIARIPNKFQKQCVKGTTAEYNIKENGEISVLNSCFDEDGEIDKAEGLARVIDKDSNAKLEVSFFSILGWRPFWGDYWIIALDENYKWAVVGTPNRKYGWILSRTKYLDQKTLDEIFRLLTENGYNHLDFVMSPQ